MRTADEQTTSSKMPSSRGATVIAVIVTILYHAYSVNAYSESDANTCEVRLRIDSGWACGRVRVAEDGTEYASFRGVPYGKPPLGELRFKELKSLDAWDYLLDATEEGPACPQKDLYYGRIPLQKKGQSEDCIYLNLHVPYKYFKTVESKYNASESANTTNETEENPSLPILVFIHGGVFQVGSGLTDLHGPEYLMTKDVIVITFNYRINIFGFLSLNTSSIPGNQGLRDQLTLLRWVQTNARAFGGNPDNITLMGQSAGASCAHLLSLSEASEGLFHRVIAMSGVAISNYFSVSPLYAQSVANLFITTLGINSTDPEYIHEQLIQMPLNEIMYANDAVQIDSGIVSFGPVIESEFAGVTRVLDDEPLTLIAAGRGKDYPLLVSYTFNEIESLKWVMLNLNILSRIEQNPLLLVFPRLLYSLSSNESLAIATEVEQRYFNGTLTLANVSKLYTDTFFKYPAFKLAEWRAALGAPTYLAQYSYESEQNIIKEAVWVEYEGAAHLDDLTYIFRVNSMLSNYNSSLLNAQDNLMRQWLPTLITNFMECSNTTCSTDESDWPQVSTSELQYQDIAEPAVYKMSELTTDQKDMIQFFDSIDSESRNVTATLNSQK